MPKIILSILIFITGFSAPLLAKTWRPSFQFVPNPSANPVWTHWTRTAMDASGNTYTLWQEQTAAGFTIKSRFQSKTGVWSAPLVVHQGTTSEIFIYPTLNISDSGLITATWKDSTGNIWIAERYAGKPWNSVKSIATNTYAPPLFAINHKGDAIVIWNSDYYWPPNVHGGTPATRKIMGIYRPAGGVWTQPYPIKQGNYVSAYQPAISDNGDVLIPWTEQKIRIYVDFHGILWAAPYNDKLHVIRKIKNNSLWQDSLLLAGSNSFKFLIKQPLGYGWGNYSLPKEGEIAPLAVDINGNSAIFINDLAGNVMVSVQLGAGKPWSLPKIIMPPCTAYTCYYRGMGNDNVGNVTLFNLHRPQAFVPPYENVENSLERVTGNLRTNTWSLPTRISSKISENIGHIAYVSTNGMIVSAGITAGQSSSASYMWQRSIQVGMKPSASANWLLPIAITPWLLNQYPFIDDIAANAAGDAVITYRILDPHFYTTPQPPATMSAFTVNYR